MEENVFNPLVYPPLEFVGYWDECNSWHDNCYLHYGLNLPASVCDMSGPEAQKFLEKYVVNTFHNRPVGKAMHAIICNDQGKIVDDGIIIKTGEDSYRSFWPAILPELYEKEKGNFDMTFVDHTGNVVMYQLCGPRSLEVLEAALEKDMHHLGFMCYEKSAVGDAPVEVLRAGMAGSLGYEIHCLLKDSVAVYEKILEAGKPYGMVVIGEHAFRNAHTEGGFTQEVVHFRYARFDHDMDALVGTRTGADKPAVIPGCGYFGTDLLYGGSMSDAPFSSLFRTPTECGWAKMVKFDHDFIGRAALEKEAENPRRVIVSLEWNEEDVMDVWASLFKSGEPYQRLDLIEDLSPYGQGEYLHQDRTFAGDKEIGISSGRVYSPHYRKIVSLCTIDKEYAELGTEVEVLWGNPGTRQKRIRATVARFPYVSTDRNEKLDVSKIPSGVPSK